MAILKHIASKSPNYGAALEYLIFKHDELRKTPILDQNGNRIMRDEFYLDGLNCEPYSFDAACRQLNREYQKNKNKNEIKSHHVGAKFIMPVPCKHRVLRAPLEQQVRIEDSHAAIVTPEEFEQAQMVIMLQHGKHQAGNYTKHQYPLKGKVYCGYCQKLMKYRVLKKLGPSFNCRFSATAVNSPCKRIPISEKLLEEIVRNALTAQIKQAEHILEILHERERKALICFSELERQEEKLSAEKAELVKLRVALYEQYADGNMSKEEFIRQRDSYRAQEDERMEQIQRLRTEKDQIFLPVRKDAGNLQTVVSAAEEAGDVMHLSQNVVEIFIDRIEVFNDERVKIRFTFEDVLAGYAE
jgi:site-specific DNA recombinase